MPQDRADGPVQACRRCRDPAQADRAKRDGRRAGSEQRTAVPATALAARGRPLHEHSAGEPRRCSRNAYAGRGKPVGHAVIRCRRTARSETATGPSASKGLPGRQLPSPRAGDVTVVNDAGDRATPDGRR